jgi:hypothetical protein
MNLEALREAWARVTGSTAAKLDAVNKLTTVGKPVDVPVAAILSYLGDRRAHLEVYASGIATSELRVWLRQLPVEPGVVATHYLLLQLDGRDGPMIGTSRPNVLAIFNAMLAAMVEDPASGITAVDKDNLLALVRPPVPLFAQPVTVLDLAAAKLA